MAQKQSGSAKGTAKRKQTAAASKSKSSTAAKKTTAKSRSGKQTAAKTKTAAANTKKATPSSGAKGCSGANKPEKRTMNPQIVSVILCAIGVFVALFALFPGAKFWLTLHTVLRGLFGFSVFPLALILLYLAYLVTVDTDNTTSKRAVFGGLLIMFLSAFVQLFFGKQLSGDLGFAETVRALYAEGQTLRGGGVISAVIAFPLVALFDLIGARIIIILLIAIISMLLMNISFADLLRICTKPFVWMWEEIVRLATDRDEYDDEDDDYDDDDYSEAIRDEEEDDDLPPWEEPAVTKEDRRKKKEKPAPAADDTPLPLAFDEEEPSVEDDPPMINGASVAREAYSNIEVDIPIFDHHGTAAPAESNPISQEQGSFAEGFTAEDEKALQDLIANADTIPESNMLRTVEEELDESLYAEEQPVPYVAPPLSLLHYVDNTVNDADKSAELKEKAKLLVDTLASFGVQVRITGIRRGPTVTRYEIQPAAGVKISKITSLQDDIGLNLGGKSVRLEAPIPGKPAVGVEVANNTKDMVTLREILETPEFQESKSKLTFAVGKDIDGNVILGDIGKMPHMIIAGTTGSGKSVCTNSIIMSILYHASPEEVRLILVDPKVVEFAPYDGIPHLLIPVVTNPQKAAGALNWAVIEMERRYALCAQYGVRDLKGYNSIAERNEGMKKLPQILIIIDEFADLMMASSKEVESAVIRIAQKARAAGIHLIIATQRPTVDVITGLIKSNVPSRIGMSVKSAQDSRIILDCSGAETLLGNGDLLFYPNGWREPKRVQGCFTSDAEVEAVASFLKSNGSSEYDLEIIEAVEQNIPTAKGDKPNDDEEDISGLSGDDALLIRAAELAVDMGQLSTTALQRRLKLGYARAARIMESMEERGIIGPSEGAKPRKVLMSPQELTEWKLRFAAKGGDVSDG